MKHFSKMLGPVAVALVSLWATHASATNFGIVNSSNTGGLNGYVSNLADGRVEAFAQGEPADIEAFARWLRHGPPLARVDAVQSVDASPEAVDGFGFGFG